MRAILPIDSALGELEEHLLRQRNLVVVAPPGAGKTTRVPQALIDRGLVEPKSKVLVLEPRRIAARLAARRIAEERESAIGGEVGYQVRFDDRTSAATRIALLTEGILTRRLQSDPVLEGVGAVVLDEIHERSIHADLALAFLREIQETVRPDLIVIAMSATIDAGPLAKFLGECPTLTSEGRRFSTEIIWLDKRDERPIPDRMVSLIRRAVVETRDGGGDLLAFFPGAPEIRRALEALVPLVGKEVELCPLYGELSAEAQDRAVTPGPRRKVVLATNIAESSLTIEGVRTVVDSGFSKVLRHDPALGIDRLELGRISRKSAEQRAGRAGRIGPGKVYRAWTKQEEQTLPPSDVPEVGRIDLAAAVLEVVRWSNKDPREFRWFEAPPPARVERALGLLEMLGAIPPGGFRLTARGETIAALPVHPRIASVLLVAKARGRKEDGALIAALLSERDVIRKDAREGRMRDLVGPSDVLIRLELIRELERARFSAAAADRIGIDLGAARAVLQVRDRLLELLRRIPEAKAAAPVRNGDPEEALLRAVLAGFPDRVARRRAANEDRVVFASGGGGRISRESVVKEGELLVAVDASAQDGGEALIRVASHIDRDWLVEDTGGVRQTRVLRFDRAREVVECVLETRYQELVLEARSVPASNDPEVARVLEEAASEDLDRALPRTEAFERLSRRMAFVGRIAPVVEGAASGAGGDPRPMLLKALSVGRRSFAELREADAARALWQALSDEDRRRLDRLAPERIRVPSGREVELRYEPDGPPVLAVRLQEVFGWKETPRVGGGKVPVKMELLAPNMRPVQVTQDLDSFWRTTYAEVRNELRRRYPKHQWPQDPKEGDPTKRPGRRRS